MTPRRGGGHLPSSLTTTSKANSISHRSPVAMTECKNWVHWMATIKGARTVALAAAIAGGMLCEALICEPAQAQVATTCTPQAGAALAFQCTQTNLPDLYVALELSDGSTE